MSGDREAMSDQSPSVHEGAGYDEVYPSGHELVEDLSWSLEKEPSTHSPVEEEEKEYEEDEKEEEEKGDWGGGEEEEEEEEEGEGGDEESQVEGDGVVCQVDNSGHRPFILP